MVASTTPPSTDPGGAADAPVVAVAVAYSAGRDSTALLHATARMAAQLGGPQGAVRVVALHVHHGLSAQADAWLDHAREHCAAWAAQGLPVMLMHRRLNLRPRAGESIEALARQARYRALADMARESGCQQVLLAHHRRDQAETFLLQALRGAGVAGLSAMPREAWRDGLQWCRPWLHQPREAIQAYVAAHGLSYVDDDSNAEVRFARNRLRAQVWPALTQAFDHAEISLAQAALHQSDVLACLDDWLTGVLPGLILRRAGRQDLDVTAWLQWPPGPRRETLRAWFALHGAGALPASWVHRLHDELSSCVRGSWPLPAQGGALRLYRGGLSWQPGGHVVAPDPVPAGVHPLSVARAGRVALPVGWGHLQVARVASGGVALSRLRSCELRPREGGEQFQLAPQRPARLLKKQFQALAVPSWLRDGPLLWAQGQLVFVPGLGVDARVWAAPGEPQVTLTWVPEPVSM